MKILFISPSINPISNTDYGSCQRSHLLLRACAKVGQTDVCTFTGEEVRAEDIPANCRLVYAKPLRIMPIMYMPLASRYSAVFGKTDLTKIFQTSKEMSAITHELVEKGGYDLIVTRYVGEAILCGVTDFMDKLVIDIDDDPVKSHLMRIRLKGGNGPFKRSLDWLKVLPDKVAMNYVQRHCRGTFYSNPEEAKCPNAEILPNISMRILNEEIELVEEKRLFFIGMLDYTPNQVGITHFVENVWPEVHKKHKDAYLAIAGKCSNTEEIARWTAVEGVKYLGFVENVEEEYRKSRLVVAPIYHGTGTNIKVLEAMSMGKACVTTPTGIRGFTQYLHDGENIVIANDDFTYAHRISHLLEEPRECMHIAQNAMQTIHEHFSREAFDRIVSDFLNRI